MQTQYPLVPFGDLGTTADDCTALSCARLAVVEVYLPGVNNAERDEALRKLDTRLKDIESADSWKNWLRSKSNKAVALTAVLTAVCAVCAFLAWVQPQMSNHAKEDRRNEINRALAEKLAPIS